MEYDTWGNINDQDIPRHNIMSFLCVSLVRLYSSTIVETDLWWLNLQVIKGKEGPVGALTLSYSNADSCAKSPEAVSHCEADTP